MSPWILILLVVALAQHVMLPHFELFNVHPNLMLTVVIAWGILRGNRDGLIWAMVGGLLLDLFSIAPIGTYTIPFLVVMALVGLLEFTVFRVTLWLPVVAAFVASPVFQLLALLFLKIMGYDTGWERTFQLLLPLAFVNATLMVVVFPLMRRVSHLAGQKGINWRQWQT